MTPSQRQGIVEELRQLRTDAIVGCDDWWSLSDGQFLDTLARATDHEIARWLAWARVNRGDATPPIDLAYERPAGGRL